jgi:acyl carrier protein
MLDDTLKMVCKVLSDLMGREVQPDETLAGAGLDSLDVVEAMLNLEEAFPEAKLDTYDPAMTTTVREIATKIDWTKVGQ